MLVRKKLILVSVFVAFVTLYCLAHVLTRLTVGDGGESVKVKAASYASFIPVALSSLPLLQCRSRNAFVDKLDVQLCVLPSGDNLHLSLINGTDQTQTPISYQSKRVVNEDKSVLLTDGTASCQLVLVNNISTPRFVIYTHSAVQNFKLRQKVRETWASTETLRRIPAVNIFVLGSSLDQVIQEQVRAESQAYQDIIQGDFVDAYRNLTLKHCFALSFLHNHTSCFASSHLPLAFKTDDDVILDLDAFTGFFLRFHASPPPRTLYCANILINELVPRDPTFKWYVTREEYAATTYPPYCYGNAYLFTWDLLEVLSDESLRVEQLWVDDVYFSGILANSLGKVTYVELPFQSPIANIATNPEDVLRMGKWLVHAWANEEAFNDYWLAFQAKRNATARDKFIASVKHRTGQTLNSFFASWPLDLE